MPQIKTLQQFYTFMMQTKQVRSDIVCSCLKNAPVLNEQIVYLKEALLSLQAIPQKKGQFLIDIENNRSLLIDLGYEISELQKDILFLEKGENALLSYFKNTHKLFSLQIQEGLTYLQKERFQNFISDRDGTVNNYCARYQTSIQSVYNAVFLTRFASQKVENAVILTSAPLSDVGLSDISTSPPGNFIYAGSKGREFLDKEGHRGHCPIDTAKQKILDILNQKLKELLSKEKFKIHTLIGSGLQIKFGQTTIARQDIAQTISPEDSQEFLSKIKDLVNEIDLEREYFRIEDTGLDIEILLTIDDAQQPGSGRDFDKSDGLDCLDKDLDLRLKDGPNLICGDTSSDIPMLENSLKKCPQTFSVFVTKDPELMGKVRTICPHAHIVDNPDILVSILNKLSK